MSGKASFTQGAHGPAISEGVTTALSWLSVPPFRGAATIDRITGARVMAAAPVVGVVLGLVTAVLLGVLGFLGVASLLSAVLVVVMWELLTRLLHLDGLSDVADALGSYAPPERARAILADPHTGLFGFSATLFSLLLQVAAVVSLIEDGMAWLVCVLPVLGGVAGQVAARAGRTPMSATGFGALVVGTVRAWWVAAWLVTLSVIAVGVALSTGNAASAWIVPAAGLVACVMSEVAARHFTRRFGDINGDCIGAGIHLGTTVASVFCVVAVVGLSTLH